jgi:uncharacterized phage protein (TIGR01671 family)
MDRVIIFRGKRIDNGEWVYGDLENPRIKDTALIHCYRNDGNYDRQHKVEIESVGQFTGCLDKNGTEIYEGDVVRVDISRFDSRIKNHRYTKSKVEWCQDEFLLSGVDIPVHFRSRVEVIGNIYDNPELLKGGDNE